MQLGFCNQVFSISPNLKKFHKVFFLKPQPPPTEERVMVAFHVRQECLLRFLYAFRFCNQANSLAPTLKVLLVFLCEAVANQLQQPKGCCGVSQVLGFVQKSQSQIRGLCIKGKNATTRSSPIAYWSKGSTVNWYFGIGQGIW